MTKYALIFILVLSSCTVYYNTYYNAEKFFEEAQETELRDNGMPARSAVKKYNEVIKKCGKIITNYPNSKYVDDAVFMIGKCNYYKKRGYSRAIEKFDELITYYPDSPHIYEAHLYKAKALYHSHKEDEAFAYLDDIIKNSDLKKIHPQALNLLANFYELNDDIINQSYYLERIIREFPKSKIYNEAYFNLAKLNFDQNKHEESLANFKDLLKSKIDKTEKLNCRYYIAYNLFYLNKFDEALKTIKKLQKDELHEKNISRDEILEARILQGQQNFEQADELFRKVIKDQNKTALAAEASYYLAEMYFIDLKEYQKAIENYNNVKTQDRDSDFVEKAVSKSAIVSQIVQYQNPDKSSANEEMVDEQFKLAEYYIEILNAPDSANVVYDKIIDQKKFFNNQVEVIADSIDFFQSQMDLEALDEMQNELQEINQTKSDSSKTITVSDSVITALSDSITFINNLNSKVEELKTRKESFIQMVKLYNSTIVPKTVFHKLWLSKNIMMNKAESDSLYNFLKDNYQENKYFYAADDLINDRKIQFESFENRRLKQRYEEIIDNLKPDSTIVELQEFIKTDNNYWKTKGNFAIGEIYYKILQDTLNARPYYQAVLDANNIEEISNEIKKYYDNNKFKQIEQLDFIFNEEMQKQKEEERKLEAEKEEVEKESEETSDESENKPTKNSEEEVTTPRFSPAKTTD